MQYPIYVQLIYNCLNTPCTIQNIFESRAIAACDTLCMYSVLCAIVRATYQFFLCGVATTKRARLIFPPKLLILKAPPTLVDTEKTLTDKPATSLLIRSNP